MNTRLMTRARISQKSSPNRSNLLLSPQSKTRTLNPVRSARSSQGLPSAFAQKESLAEQANSEKSAHLSFDLSQIPLTAPPSDSSLSSNSLQAQESPLFPENQNQNSNYILTKSLIYPDNYFHSLPLVQTSPSISATGDFRIQGIFGKIKKAVKKGTDWVKKKVVEPIKKAAKKLLNGLKQKAKSFINGLKKVARRLANSAKQRILRFINQIKRAINRLIKRARNLANKILTRIQMQAKRLVQRFARIAQRLLLIARKKAQKYAQRILKLAQKLTEMGNPQKVQDLIQKLQQFTDRIINWARSKVMAVVGRATKFIDKLIQKGIQKAHQGITKVSAGVQRFIGKINNGVKNILNKVRQAIEKVIQKTGQVNQIFEKAKNKLNEILGPARKVASWLIGQMMGLANQVLRSVLLPLAKQASKFMQALIRPVTQVINRLLAKGIKLINQGLQKVVKWITDKASWFLLRIKRLIEEFIEKIVNKGLNLATGLVQKLVSGIIQMIEKIILEPLKAFFEFMSLITQMLAKSASALDKILAHPVNFIKSLFSSIKEGLNGFASRLLQHLQAGLKTFLLGPIANMGVELPESFDMKGILSVVTQLSGLSYNHIREKASSKLGEEKVAFLEEGIEATQTGNLSEFAQSKVKGYIGSKQEDLQEKMGPLGKVMELFGALRSGPGGIVNYFQELDFNSLMSTVIDGIKDYLKEEIIQKAIIQIKAYLIPGAGWLKAAIDALRVMYSVFIKRAQQVKEIVEGFTDSVADAAKQAVVPVAKRLEGVLGKSIPVLIGILADYLGIGGLPAKIQGFLKKGQKWVDTNVMPLIDKILDTVAGVFAKIPKFDRGSITKKIKQGGLSLYSTVKAGIRPLTQKSYSTLTEAQSAISQAAREFTGLGLKSLSLEPVKQQTGVYQVIARKPLATHNSVVDAETLRKKQLATTQTVSKLRRGFDLMQIPIEYQGPSIQLAKSNKSVGRVKVEEEGKQKRIADLPSLKKVTIDWQHIYDGHWQGTPPQQRGNNTVFHGLSKQQIQRVVKGAYKQISKKLQTQGDRIKVRGEFDGWLVEFWVNKSTKVVETAYPIL